MSLFFGLFLPLFCQVDNDKRRDGRLQVPQSPPGGASETMVIRDTDVRGVTIDLETSSSTNVETLPLLSVETCCSSSSCCFNSSSGGSFRSSAKLTTTTGGMGGYLRHNSHQRCFGYHLA
jgi:hypothetical protein